MVRLDYKLVHTSERAPKHSHEYAQIFLPTNAPLCLIMNDKQYLLTNEELGFMPPNTPHQCVLQDDLIVINIPLSMIKKEDLEILSNNLIYPIQDSLKPLIELIRSEAENNRASLRYLYFYLYDCLVENNSFASVQYIREHFDQSIRVAQLAKLENYNLAYFYDWFKRQTNYTPSQYLTNYRIEKAQELLRSTDYKIIDIAIQVGFSSNASFSRAFKRKVGLSPLSYRENK